MEESTKANPISNISARARILGSFWKDILQQPHYPLYRDKQQEAGTAFKVQHKKDNDLVTEQIIIFFVRHQIQNYHIVDSLRRGQDRVRRTIALGMLVAIEVVYPEFLNIPSWDATLLHLLTRISIFSENLFHVSYPFHFIICRREVVNHQV
jgi:hypothetical protein